MPLLSVIIPTCNRNILLNETLKNLFSALSNIDAEIIVVNDSKTQKPVISFSSDNIYLLNNPKNGAASARNFGAKHAQGQYLLFLDDDMILLQQSITKLISLAKEHSHSCFNLNWTIYPPLLEKISHTLFGKYLIHYNFTSLQGWYGIKEHWQENNLIQVSSITSQALWIEKEIFWKIGGYAEDIPFAGFEDYILSENLRKNNINMYVYSTILAYHNEADRVDLLSFLERKKRGGATRASAVKLGYKELDLKHSFTKRLVYLLFYYLKLKYFFLLIAMLFEKLNRFEKIYFKIVNALLGIYHFEGYWENSIKTKKIY
jgi:GT2 family glycosyltransferase